MFLNAYAKRKKLEYFFEGIPKDAAILEIGCADGWVGEYAKTNGWHNFTGMDILPSSNADVVGDINEWKSIGLKEKSYDAIIAFEVIEHGDFYKSMYDLLKPGGKVYVTTPMPHFDWVCKILEALKLIQKRSSAHTHLIYLEKAPHLELVEKKVMGFISQWGVYQRAA
jgi:2-polyprenyl-3-methyl-5-hydroxy-6-metoxy-1,4-benzoquinol methylase